ncbi:MAG TPA: FAD-dependent oxidoreductase [Longimicrobiaceae bacterium]|nr:FAD-dependent oxidoreductase [Longimicrobiaceae bacterium]
MLHSTRLRHRKLVAHETLAIGVDRPGEFDFEAGQYADLTVFNAGDRDALGPIRSLSIASVPGADYLEFIMRVRDTAFKRSLATLPVGADLLVEGPFDDLGFSRENGREMVFIAGGVGIAPFMSVLRETAAAGGELPATLFYSNRRPEDAAYLEELRRLEDDISGLRLVPTMTGMAESSLEWEGETARLEMDLLERYLPSIVGPSYYIVGSPTLISQMRRTLTGAGVPDADIGLEMYSGY